MGHRSENFGFGFGLISALLNFILSLEAATGGVLKKRFLKIHIRETASVFCFISDMANVSLRMFLHSLDVSTRMFLHSLDFQIEIDYSMSSWYSQ